MSRSAGSCPVPARITLALDAAGLDGPQVDIDLGGTEPMVDDWEAGKSEPTPEQVERLAAMTDFPVAFFYEPPSDLERQPNTAFICQRSRRADNGLTVVSSRIGEDGVLHIQELTPTRPPYRPRASTKEATVAPRQSRSAPPRRVTSHQPQEDPDAPGSCRCGLPLGAPNARHAGWPDNPGVELDARRLGEAGQQ